MSAKQVQSITDTILTSYHARVVNKETYFFVEGSWHHSARKLDELIVAIDRKTTRADRAEIRDLVSLSAPDGEFAPGNYIAFANGNLDIETMRLTDPSPDLIVPNPIPWEWDATATSGAVEDYLDSTAANDPSVRTRIEEMLGCCLYRGDAPYIFVLVGAAPVADGNASNGKSTLIRVATGAVGEDNAQSVDIHVLGERFVAASLRGALVDVSSDTESSKPTAASLSVLKRASSTDPIDSDVKNGARIRFKSYATFIIAANRVPGFLVDAGLRSRTVPIPLKAKFPRHGADPSSVILTPEHMPALLALAVRGLKRLLADGPSPCSDGDEAFGSIVALSSTVEQWVDEKDIDAASLHGEPVMSSYSGYDAWCYSAGSKAVPKIEFELEVQNRFPALAIKKCRFQGKSTTRRWIDLAQPATKY